MDRQFVFEATEKEKLRTFMRMYEGFSGNRVLSYCFMSNHIHLLVEITPPPADGLTDEELLARLGYIQSEAQVAAIAQELSETRKLIADGLLKNGDDHIQAIHGRFTYRMHDLSEFMKGFLRRYTQWHNKRHDRCGHLWEDRFKSVIVEDGAASRTIAAYIDLNPVRAGIVKDPADYRWCSYGEATRGEKKTTGKVAQAGLVRAFRAHRGIQADATHWPQGVATEYRHLLMLGANESTAGAIDPAGESSPIQIKKSLTSEKLEQAHSCFHEAETQQMNGASFSQMLRHPIRYFTAGAVIGSRDFVNAAFAAARDRFGPNRKDGARKLRGPASPAAGILWSLRDLQKGMRPAGTKPPE